MRFSVPAYVGAANNGKAYMRPAIEYVRHHAIAILALICSLLALAGASYASFGLPAGSVGARQLRDNSITPAKFNHKLINGAVRAWAIVAANGRVIAGGGQPRVFYDPGLPGQYPITWGVNLPHACATVANINSQHSAVTEGPPTNLTAGYAVVGNAFRGKGRHNNGTGVETFDQAGRWRPLAFYVAVIC
jgi:hypothetical protein